MEAFLVHLRTLSMRVRLAGSEESEKFSSSLESHHNLMTASSP